MRLAAIAYYFAASLHAFISANLAQIVHTFVRRTMSFLFTLDLDREGHGFHDTGKLHQGARFQEKSTTEK